MMTLLKYVLLGLGLIAMAGCIDEIDLNIDNESQFVIVDGLVSDVPGEYKVKLDFSPVIGVGNDNILTPISGAQVSLIGDNGTSVPYTEDDEDLGVYKAFTSVTPGISYHIDITTPDGQNITSIPTIAPESSLDITELDFEVAKVENFNVVGNITVTDFVDLFVSLDLAGKRRHPVRWRLDGEYQYLEQGRMLLNPKTCYIKETIDFNNIAILNTEEVATETVENVQLFRTLMNHRFHLLYCFHVFQYALTDEEYNYWSRVEELVNIDGTLFDPPPGSIIGNLVNNTNENGRVQGYFSVVGQTSKRFFVDVSKKDEFARSECADGFAGRNNPPRCSQCTLIRNSTLVKPPYWKIE